MNPLFLSLWSRRLALASYAAAAGIVDDQGGGFRARVVAAVASEPTLAGPLLRLAFHDAVRVDDGRGGPNGSIRYELDEMANVGLGRPLQVVLDLKGGQLSLADAIAVAGAAAVEAAGGPVVRVPLGRTDATSPDPVRTTRPFGEARDAVLTTLPSPGLSTVGVRRFFRRLRMRDDEIVALMGAHTLGRHVSLLNMTKSCLRNLTRACLETAPVRLAFEPTPDVFDNSYFVELLKWENRTTTGAFIPTDVTLLLDPKFRSFVVAFANDEQRFRRTFASAYTKLVRPR